MKAMVKDTKQNDNLLLFFVDAVILQLLVELSGTFSLGAVTTAEGCRQAEIDIGGPRQRQSGSGVNGDGGAHASLAGRHAARPSQAGRGTLMGGGFK